MKYKVSTAAGAIRARGAALKALRSALDALTRLDGFMGTASTGTALVGLSVAILDGTIAAGMEATSPASDEYDRERSYWDRLDRARELDEVGGMARRLVRESVQAVADAEVRRREQADEDRAHRLDAALRDDPTGSRFDSLDAEQEAVSGLRLRGAC